LRIKPTRIKRYRMSTSTKRQLSHLNFDNAVLRELPVDDSKIPHVRQVSGACYSLVDTDSVDNPKLISYSEECLDLLDIDENEIKKPDFVEYFSGNKTLTGSQTAAHCYCGHQFGYFSGQLGDGRAIYLGEIINFNNERWELQLKGAGKTPFSRTADGRAVLRSSIREFLCSEAMFHLNIPTTRAASLIVSDTKCMRDPLYDGHPLYEPCTIVSRIAPSFIRFGSFEIFKDTDPKTDRKGPSVGKEVPILFNLLDYVIKYHYPDIQKKHPEPKDKKARYTAFYREITERTARLAAEWQCVGFAHGVLNTDNMSILGLTLDYGPFGFVDFYDPGFICNGSDKEGRYAFEKQPEICKWNLSKLAEAIDYALPKEESLKILEDVYDSVYTDYFHHKMMQKLGLNRTKDDDDKKLVESLLETLTSTGADMTNTFRNLNKLVMYASEKEEDCGAVLTYVVSQCPPPEEYASRFKSALPEGQLRAFIMLAQQGRLEALAGEAGVALLRKEMETLKLKEEWAKKSPEGKLKSDTEAWKAWLDKYQIRLNKEVAGLNEDELKAANTARVEAMNAVNPKYVLRNYIAQKVIEDAETGDYTLCNRVFEMLRKPFAEGEEFEDLDFGGTRPKWAAKLCVTCSS